MICGTSWAKKEGKADEGDIPVRSDAWLPDSSVDGLAEASDPGGIVAENSKLGEGPQSNSPHGLINDHPLDQSRIPARSVCCD
jgi:hypothetical protein